MNVLPNTNELKPENEVNTVPASFDDTDTETTETADSAVSKHTENTAGETPDEAAAEPKPSMTQEEMDVSVEEHALLVHEEDEAAHAEKLAQIREALSMVNPRTEELAAKPQKPKKIPPLKRHGSKSAVQQHAAAETVPVKKAPAKPAQSAALPPLRKKTQPAVKPAETPAAQPVQKPAAKPALAPLKRVGSSSGSAVALKTPDAPAAPEQSTAPEKAAAPKAPAKPLAPLRRVGTPGRAAAAAAETKPITVPEQKETAEPKSPAPEKKQKEKTKKTADPAKAPISVKKLCAVFGGAAAGAIVLAYVIVALTYQNTLLPNTRINQVDVSNMTREEAEAAILAAKPVQDLVFVTANNENVTIKAADYSATYALPENALDEAFQESNWLWIKKLFAASDYTTDYVFSFSQEQLRTSIMAYEWGSESSQDAYIAMGDDGLYEIIPETIGDKFDEELLAEYAGSKLDGNTFSIAMLDSGCYEDYLADIVSEDLTESLEQCNRFAGCSITFDFSDRQKVVDGQMIADWVVIKSDGSYEFDTDSMALFVAEMANETDTYGKSRTFRSTLDGTITVPWTELSMYGWQIDQTATIEQMKELIEAGEAVTVAPTYTGWGYGYCRDTDDIGDTFIEVDISAQHVWYYKDGALVMESDCVTGTETDPSRTTPRGIFQIWSHESPRKLGTYAVQGYETWVDYWMPVNYGGIGLHDMGRSAFGGDIYMYNGSHGCINLPHSFAESLFYATENGIPVIIHD